MHPFLASLLAGGPVVTDGAWGTELQKLGLGPGEHPDLWNLSHADSVADVASRYVEAGSTVILTNTFRSNRIALAAHGQTEDPAALNAAGVRISRKAAAGRARVFASVGPSGKMLLSEEVTEEELAEAFTEQCRALAGAGADALLIETMSDLEEARIAARAAKTTGLPVIVSMVFDSGKEKDRTMMGSTPEQVAAALEEAGADAIGANCGLGIEGYIPVCARLRKATSLPLWIKPNAGLPVMADGRITYRTSPGEFGAGARDLRRAGADFIGGCCGTTPEFIRAVSAALRPVR
ncbi:MAG TPA: homocysteine S-methyltransferase family protein [Bacteroidota bacterium]|nr:homocysteine S-methyltransferase family protein [Bacteroidota bacterium]